MPRFLSRVMKFYCPRCNRAFWDMNSNNAGHDKMIAHVKKAHPAYYKLHFEDEGD